MQIRTRLTLLFLLLAASILAAVLASVYWMFKTNTEQSFYRGLAAQVEVTAQTVLREKKLLVPLPPHWLVLEEGDPLPYQDNISIFDNAYQRVFTSRTEAIPTPAKALQEIYQHGSLRFRHFNLHALGIKTVGPDGMDYVVVAEGYCNPKEINELRNILIFSFLIGVLLVAFSGWYYAGKALQPVAAIVREVTELQPSDLSRRLQTAEKKDEIGQLAKAFNLLLERVERAFSMQKMFVSNVSHELKNPLTAIRSQLDVLLQRERSPQEYQSAINSVLEDLRGLGETEEKLLQLAKVYSNPQSIPLDSTRLDELIWVAAEQLKKQHPEYQAIIELQDMPANSEILEIKANEPLLRLALLNLMNNACKYAPDKRVTVRACFQPNGKHMIEICDRGPGIPDEEKMLIFEPFYRSPRHLSVKGTGIGLSLVKSILNMHEIDISVESPLAGGSIFRLIFT